MNYQDRIWRETHPPEVRELTFSRREDAEPLPRSYTKPEREPRRSQKSKPRPPSFWDLVYVILQPPIVLQQLENLYLPHDLFPYQPAGIEFLMNNESALLADEMGTGKTVMTSVAIRILMQKGRASRALVVCPLSVLREWRRHLDEWAPDLLVTFVRGSRSTRRLDWKMPAHVYVTTYDTLRSDIETGTLPRNKLNVFDIVVLDEAQSIKNPSSSRSRAIRRLDTRQRWALTGTPIENKVEDIGSLFDFLRPGYLAPSDLYPTRIKERIAPYFLRRRKADVLPDLPRKQKQDIWLELDEVQRVEYDQVAERVRYELAEIGPRVTKMDIMQRIQRLKQICNFSPGRHTGPKLDFLKEQIEEISESGQKVIVFSQYLGEGIDKLNDALRPYGTARIVGGQSESARNSEIERFKHSTETPILLASVRAGGLGLNLTEASYVVHFDHWWNPAVMWQAEARVHRPGQTRGVNVYSYWMTDTIEERIYRTLQDKGLLFEDVVDGLSETQFEELISTQDWLEMLGVKVKEEVQPQLKRRTFASVGLVEIREHLYSITPAAFEELVKELMHSLGYPNVKVKGRTGDGGVDVVSSRNTSQGVVRAVAQCKRYKGTVGVEVARELRGVMASDESIQKGFLVTTGEFSRACIGFCERSNGLVVPISGLQVANYVKQFGLAV
ncbi:MAG: restriction endonuclease [Chloroflexi bacterium]|nr:restriction endonuclease [Chloroflexota bacterium]